MLRFASRSCDQKHVCAIAMATETGSPPNEPRYEEKNEGERRAGRFSLHRDSARS